MSANCAMSSGFAEMGSFAIISGWILGVVILIRPLGVIASSFRTDLGIRERCFLSWMAPRGIVAGSMASLFALKLKQSLGGQAKFFTGVHVQHYWIHSCYTGLECWKSR